MNIGKVLVGGLVAGVIINAGDFVANNYIVATDWQAVTRIRNIDPAVMMSTAAMTRYIVVDFLIGLLIVFTYAAIRPRFGGGAGTAVKATLIPFAAVTLVMFTMADAFFPMQLFMKTSALALVGWLAGGLAGAWLYTEDEPAQGSD